MSYPIFKDLDKSVTDIFSEDFDMKYTLKIKTGGPAGSTFTTTTQYEPSKETKLSSKVGVKISHSQLQGFTLDKLEVAGNGAVTTETSLAGAAPGLKLEFKGNDSNKGDLGFVYSVPAATLTGELDTLNFSKATASLSGGHGPISAGVSADLNIAKSTLGSVDAKVVYTVPSLLTVCAKSTNKFSDFSLLFSYAVTKNITFAGLASYTPKATNGFLAAVHKCSPNTTIKVKAATNGTLNASWKQAFAGKFSVVSTTEVPPGLSSIKFGLNATLG